MIRLLRVELTRLWCRRAVVVLLGLALVIPLVIGVATVWNTRPPSPAEQARVERLVAEESESRWVQRELRRCLDNPGQWGLEGSENVQAACEQVVLPTADWYSSRGRLDLAQEREEGSGIAVVLVVGLLMFLLGTTFAGHDWNSGSVSNQLLFEPRRLRVWAAKALAVLAVTGGVAALVLSGYWLALAAVARSRDLGPPEGVLLDCLQFGWRAAAVAAFAAVGGYALTMLFRSTVATLGILFVVALAGGVIIAVLGIDEQWNPAINLQAVVWDGATYYAPCGGANADYCERTLEFGRGLSYVAAFLALAVISSVGAFSRRDVP